MNRKTISLLTRTGIACTALAWAFHAQAAEKAPAAKSAAAVPPALARDTRAALARGAKFLIGKQEDNGSWLHSPAITALVCTALHQCDTTNSPYADAIDRARKFILQHVQDDGAICPKDRSYVNYSTAISLSALATLNNPADASVMRGARHFLIDLQLDEDNKDNPTQKTDPFFGGIGYGSGGPKCPDLSNTQLALEALYMTEHLDRDTPYAAKSKLCWQNAIQFLQSVQKVPKDAGPTWIVNVEDDSDNDGGFIYRPDQSKATDKMKEAGENVETLRSYASMTYAGLKSMIYAKLEKDDIRVKAARDWASRHYTLDENPGMGPEGHYYYMQTFAKALAAYGEDTLKTADGAKRPWRIDVIRKLLQLQKSDGQWFNDVSGRWQESIPELVTCYAMISLEVALSDGAVTSGK